MKQLDFKNVKFFDYTQKNDFKNVQIRLNYLDNEFDLIPKINQQVYFEKSVIESKSSPLIFSSVNGISKGTKKVPINSRNDVANYITIEKNEIKDNEMNNFNFNKNNLEYFDIFKTLKDMGVFCCSTGFDFCSYIINNNINLKYLVINFADLEKYTLTYKFLFNKFKNEIYEFLKQFLPKLNVLKLFFIINENMEIGELESFLNLSSNCEIKIIKVKSIFDFKVKLFLNKIPFSISLKKLLKKKILLLDAKTLVNSMEALNNLKPVTSTYVTIIGDAIENQFIAKFPNGVLIEDILPKAILKNTYDKFDAFVYNAMEAINDQKMLEEDVNNAKSEKEKLKNEKLLQEKKSQAQKIIYNNISSQIEYYNNCLGLIYEVKGFRKYAVYSVENSITPCTSSLVFVTRNTFKTMKNERFYLK